MKPKSKKPIIGKCKLQVPAGKASPGPVGPALGQRGVNIMEFCKAFNATTKNEEPGIPIPVLLTVYQDKSFTFETKRAPVSYYVKKMASVKKGSSNPGREEVAKISKSKVTEIAKIKMKDMNAFTIESAERMVIGSARSMGMSVSD